MRETPHRPSRLTIFGVPLDDATVGRAAHEVAIVAERRGPWSPSDGRYREVVLGGVVDLVELFAEGRVEDADRAVVEAGRGDAAVGREARAVDVALGPL